MDLKEIKKQKELLEKTVLKIFNEFELKSNCQIENIAVKRKRIEAGIGSRDVIDGVMIKILLG